MSDHWASLFYLDYLHRSGFKMEYLNVDKITLNQYETIVNNCTYLPQVTITDIDQFEQYIVRMKETAMFIPCATISPVMWPIFKLLIKHRVKTYYIHVGEKPKLWEWTYSAYQKNGLSQMRRRLKKFSIRKLAKRWIFEHQKRAFISRLNGAFVAGRTAYKIHRKYQNPNIIPINVRDYDDALFGKNKWVPPDDMPADYCVFLDGYWPYHPDNVKEDIRIDADTYYQSLNRMFDAIEKRIAIPVVIAAHPKSDYETIGNKFDSRILIKGQTRDLIQQSRFVLLHESTAFSYALIYEKPMVFLTDNQADTVNGFLGYRIRQFKNFFGSPIINIDKSHEVEAISEDNISICRNKYHDYILDYLASFQSRHCPSSEIILNEFNKAF